MDLYDFMHYSQFARKLNVNFVKDMIIFSTTKDWINAGNLFFERTKDLCDGCTVRCWICKTVGCHQTLLITIIMIVVVVVRRSSHSTNHSQFIVIYGDVLHMRRHGIHQLQHTCILDRIITICQKYIFSFCSLEKPAVSHIYCDNDEDDNNGKLKKKTSIDPLNKRVFHINFF